ncbi:putative mas3 protein [Phaeomoniella chlamydospora]|uniref:Putative mas3 protein n=1 Tax=Phaeomoniella chlamydospora TaxID=158046 RepID=A0A0G2GB10_PHACM|nr:putative mas3 protein [Phaeomoniella chlamydospora]
MRYSVAIAIASLLAQASAHGVVTQIQGANGVNMPGLSVQDGTPRDCASPSCGSEADTSIIRDNELGTDEASALGRTKGGGPVDAAAAISNFMGGSSTNTSTTKKRGLLGDLLGGDSDSSSSDSASTSDGTKTADGSSESQVAATAGQGQVSGLPTADDNGTVTMTFHQVNQDGAGPLSAQIDSTSGGTDTSAFEDAQVTQDVPGIGIGGLSGATTTDFPVKVQMAQGTVCSGTSGGASNVCIVRVQNSAAAGPFGGSAAFTQSAAGKKRALEYRLKQRGLHVARGVVGKP